MAASDRNQIHEMIDIAFAKNIVKRQFRNLFMQVKEGKTPTIRPLFLHSSPGIGKSAIVKQVVRELADELDTKVGFKDFRLASCEASDVNGIPYVSHAGEATETMKFSIPDWFPMDQKSFGVLFFDELSNAPISVQHAAYRIVYDRELHDGVTLPPGWLIIAAGNLKSDKTGVKGLAPALANRFGSHLYIQENVDAFLNYAAANRVHDQVLGFLSFKGDALYRPSKNGEDEAFPSPRSWEAASEHLYGGFEDDELGILMAGCVGKGTAAEFMGFRAYYGKLPDFRKIMDGSMTYKVPKGDQGLSFAIVSSLISATVEHNGDKKKMENLHKVLEQLDDEFITFFFKRIKGSNINLLNIMATMTKSLSKVSFYIK